MQGGVIYKEVYINYLLCQPVIIIIVLIIITTRSYGYNNNGSPRHSEAQPCFTAYRVPRKVLTREIRVAAMGLKRSLEGFLKSSFNRDFPDDKCWSRGCDTRKVKSTMVSLGRENNFVAATIPCQHSNYIGSFLVKFVLLSIVQ